MKNIKMLCAALSLAAPLSALAVPTASPGTEGYKVISGIGDVIATYLGADASFSNDLYLVTDDGIAGNDIFLFNNKTSPLGMSLNLGSFSMGSELKFRLHVNDTGADFFTGDASRNPDNAYHARAQAEWMPGTTLVSFEDRSDFDFNDLSFSFLNTSVDIPDPVPEPASALLIGAAFAGLVAARRRQSGSEA